MGKITNSPNLSNLTDPKEFQRHASIAVGSVVDKINGGLEFDKNFNSQTVSVVFDQANTDVAVAHTLGRTGLKYLKAQSTADCSVYDGSKPATKDTIYLRSTQPATVSLVLL